MPTTILPLFESLLKSNLPPGHPPLCVFDCDGTIIKGDIGEAMFYYQIEHLLFRVSPAEIWTDHPDRAGLDNLYQKLRKNPGAADRSLFAEMLLAWYFDQLAARKTAKACADIVRLFTGFSVIEIRKIADDTLQHELSSPVGSTVLGKRNLPTGIRFIAESRVFFDAMRERNFDIWVISGSIKWGVEAVFALLDVPPERILGIELEQHEDFLTSTVKTPIPVLQGKVDLLDQRSPHRPSVVFSDSIYDMPLFLSSEGLKVLINSRGSSSADFFGNGNVTRDNTWMVIEQPTTTEVSTTDTAMRRNSK